MEYAARRFARRTLLVHALLLAAVLVVVAVAGRQIYRAARDEVVAQAQTRQQLLAAQTARGIENHYKSILTDMDLLRRADVMATNGTMPGNTSTDRTISRLLASAGWNPGVGQLVGGIMWRQLQGRATMLFACDRAASIVNGRLTATPRLIGSDDPAVTPDEIVRKSTDWLKAQSASSVGEFGRWGDVSGNLVVVPLGDQSAGPPVTEIRGNGNRGGGGFRGGPLGGGGGGGRRGPTSRQANYGDPGDHSGEHFGDHGPSLDESLRGEPPLGEPRVGDREPPADRIPRDLNRVDLRVTVGATRSERALVAVVPIDRVETDFLRPLDDAATGAWLVDQGSVAMAASRPDLVGADMNGLADPELQQLVTRYISGHASGSEQVNHGFTVGKGKFAASMVAAEPVDVANRHWELFVATSLDSVSGNVNRLFRRAVGWGAGLSVAVAVILASTATGLIRGRVRVERLRHQVLNRELAEARRIQLAWLPKSMPSSGAIDVAAVNSPASHISGDFYNWFDLPDGRLAVTIGDVTGHGMAAAFLMATTQLLVRNTLLRVPDPGACLEDVNRQLCVQAFNGQFVTMLVAVLDPERRQLLLATAGHPAPMLVALAPGACRSLPVEPQLVLGIECDATYATESHDLPPGATLVLYTDGVIECPASDATLLAGQRFGPERLRQAVRGSTSAKSLVDGVVSAVDAFRGPRELDDDFTVVAVQLRA